MSIKRLSYENLQSMAAEIEKKFAGKSDLEALQSVVAGKADTATTLAGYGIVDGMTATEIAIAISTAVAGADHLQRKIVDRIEVIDLSAADADKYIYLVPKNIVKTADGEMVDGEAAKEESKTVSDGNTYDEYMIINGALERMGDWKVDLSDYAKTTQVLQAIAAALTVDPVGSGNVVTGFQFNPDIGKMEVEKGITALQASDFEEYTPEEIQALFT